MLDLLALYLPSLIGLLVVNWQLYEMFRIAREENLATPFIMAMTTGFIGVLVSWLVVLVDAYIKVDNGSSLLGWRVALLPIGWAILLFFINRWIRE